MDLYPQGDSGSETAFRLDFEFASGLLCMALGGFFKEVSESMVDAFCRQAAKNMSQGSLLEKPRCPSKAGLFRDHYNGYFCSGYKAS
ncbi:MAG: hypothetical protein EBT06_06610 [Gammaproteobacteria bacterium]|nr:hypothetical protein [Gammaproteobacteria bacterium]NBT44582.1 hypothetical protein [Gammaproteobacteria bacterium]NBY22336.1 hypothetical protein [Gammaproteobacteria bacterium]